MRRSSVAALLMAAFLALAGCASSSSTGKQAPQFSDIPLPQGYKIETGKTMVLGSGSSWSGRLVYFINSTPSQMFDFYRREMPNMGWRVISLYRAPTSVLTYSKSSRVATIQINSGWIYGSDVSIVMAPEATAPASNGAATTGRPGTAPKGGVTVQPMK